MIKLDISQYKGDAQQKIKMSENKKEMDEKLEKLLQDCLIIDLGDILSNIQYELLEYVKNGDLTPIEAIDLYLKTTKDMTVSKEHLKDRLVELNLKQIQWASADYELFNAIESYGQIKGLNGDDKYNYLKKLLDSVDLNSKLLEEKVKDLIENRLTEIKIESLIKNLKTRQVLTDSVNKEMKDTNGKYLNNYSTAKNTYSESVYIFDYNYTRISHHFYYREMVDTYFVNRRKYSRSRSSYCEYIYKECEKSVVTIKDDGLITTKAPKGYLFLSRINNYKIDYEFSTIKNSVIVKNIKLLDIESGHIYRTYSPGYKIIVHPDYKVKMFDDKIPYDLIENDGQDKYWDITHLVNQFFSSNKM